ncbi:MAG: hypothetical protein M1837_004473 [Sclerophora amabilis]|nr:MAG: hypothetical protein M1837_004473 [Sclerophora amabilis]
MHAFLQFITTPTVDTPGTTLLLHFDNKRYLIGNVAEGTQRAFAERSVRCAKLQECFITGRTEWANIGGLIGMLLTVADTTSTAISAVAENAKVKEESLDQKLMLAMQTGQDRTVENLLQRKNRQREAGGPDIEGPRMTIHGGRNIMHVLATARRFIFRRGMPMEVNEWKDHSKDEAAMEDTEMELEPTWSDENVKVWAMSIVPEQRSDSRPSSQTSSVVSSSSRKRGHAEVDGENRPDVPVSEREKRDMEDQMRRAVVSEMFNSNWRLDSLVEVPLRKVHFPATLYQRNPESGGIEPYDGPLPGEDGSLPESHLDVKVLRRSPWPGAMIESLPPTKPAKESMCYIFRPHYQRGKFLPEKAAALQVERGQKYAMLARGNTVTAADGKTVTPDMVMTEGREGNGFAVVDLPSVDYVKGLVRRREWRNQELMRGIKVIVWILGPSVHQDPQLLGFLKEMAHLQHIFSSPEHCPNYLAFNSAGAASVRLHQIDQSRYPVPVHNNVPSTGSTASGADGGLDAVESAQRGNLLQLEPNFEIQDRHVVPFLNTAQVCEQAPSDVLSLADAAKESLSREEVIRALDERQKDLPGKDAEIITLGTGSALPSKYRNVSATLLRIPGRGSYLFDCGENTMGQLSRVFTTPQLAEVLRDLRAIWISHLHADHHLGTISVIKAWHHEVWGAKSDLPSSDKSTGIRSKFSQMANEDGQKRLSVISDSVMLDFLQEYASVEDFGLDKIVPLSIRGGVYHTGYRSSILWGDSEVGLETPGNKDLRQAMLSRVGVSDIQAAEVDHCHGAKAVSLTFSDGFKFSYSGDCRPSGAFEKIGKGSTVLLHEATFDDELQGDALAKKHSTTSEAIEVGLNMEAKRILLTHFSQRYQKIPVMDQFDGPDPAAQLRNNGRSSNNYREGSASHTQSSHGQQQSLSIKRSPSNERVVKVKASDRTDVNIGVAFDLMRVKVGEISHLEYFAPALTKLYEHLEPEDSSVEADEEVPTGTKSKKSSKKKSKDVKDKGKAKKER